MANELIVQLVIDPKSVKSEGQKLENDTKKIGEKVGLNLQGAISGGVTKSIAAIGKSVLGLGAVIGAGLGFKTIIRSAIEAEDALNKLNVSLKLAGAFSKGASRDFNSFADAIESTTTFTAEQVLIAASLARNYARTNEETKRLTAAAIDLSKATGTSLEGAIDQLGKTLVGTTGLLGRQVVELNNLTEAELRAGAAIDVVAKRFKGAAEGDVNTFGGAIIQLGNAFGKIPEEIGKLLTTNTKLISFIQGLSASFISFADSIASGKITDSINTFINNLIRIGAQVIVLGTIIKSQAVFTLITTGLSAAITALATAGFAFTSFALKVKIGITSIITSIKLLKASLTLGLTLVLDAIIEKFLILRDSGAGASESLGNSLKSLGLNLQLFLANLALKFVELFSKLPVIGADFIPLVEGYRVSIKALEQDIDKLLKPKEPLKIDVETGGVEGEGSTRKPFIDLEAERSRRDQFLAEIKNFGLTELQIINQQEFEKLATLESFRNTEVGAQINFEETKTKIQAEYERQRLELTAKADEQRLAALKTVGTLVAGAIQQTTSAFISRLGASLVQGKSAFSDFRGFLFNLLGDVAIQIGTTILFAGEAIEALKASVIGFFGGQAIAAGIALIALGGLLKSLGGSGPSAGATAPSGQVPAPVDNVGGGPGLEAQETKPSTNIAINIQGDVLDSPGTNLRIVELLKEELEKSGNSILTVA